jgi:hypothetical protein
LTDDLRIENQYDADGNSSCDFSPVDCSQVRDYASHCSNITQMPFENECQFVTEECGGTAIVLINYISFIYCTMPDVKASDCTRAHSDSYCDYLFVDDNFVA